MLSAGPQRLLRPTLMGTIGNMVVILIIGVVRATTVLMRTSEEEEIAAHSSVAATGINMIVVFQSTKKRATIITNIKMTAERDGEKRGKRIGHVIVQPVGGNGTEE